MAAWLADMSADDYHADPLDEPSLNSTTVKVLLAQSPLHARAQHPRLTDEPLVKKSKAMDIGTAVHAMLLQGENVVEVVEATDWRTKAAKEQADEIRAAGRIPMLDKDYQRVVAINAAVRPQIAAIDTDPPLLANGKAEQVVAWSDNGVLCRARLDHLTDDHAVIDDLKTEGISANPVTWQRTMFDRNYHIQAQFYRRGIRALTGKLPDFRFIVVESNPPYAVSVCSPSPRAYELADQQIDAALRIWKQCLTGDVWPGYTTRVCHIDPPAYTEMRWADQEALLEEAA